MPGDADPGGELGTVMWGCSLTHGFGGNCPGERTVLLPGFALGMSPDLVQPSAMGLEDSPCAQEKIFMQIS